VFIVFSLSNLFVITDEASDFPVRLFFHLTGDTLPEVHPTSHHAMKCFSADSIGPCRDTSVGVVLGDLEVSDRNGHHAVGLSAVEWAENAVFNVLDARG